MNSFFRWFAGHISLYLSEQYCLNLAIKAILPIETENSVIFILNEGTSQDTIASFATELKKIIPEDKFIILTADGPVSAVRIA